MARDKWVGQLSPATREVWMGFPPDVREQATEALKRGQSVDAPDLALVVGEMQVLTHRPAVSRAFRWTLRASIVYYAIAAVVLSPWWLVSLAVSCAYFGYLRRIRALLGIGLSNLETAAAAGHTIAYRYREQFPELSAAAAPGRNV